METVFVPNGRRYLVLLDEQQGETVEVHGLKLTTDAEKHKKPTKGTAIAIGDGYDTEAGVHMTMKYQIGARLVFGKYAGVDYLNEKGRDCVILAEAEILGEEVPLPLDVTEGDGQENSTLPSWQPPSDIEIALKYSTPLAQRKPLGQELLGGNIGS